MRPHYPDTYEGCLNGCDSTLCEILKVNTSRTSPTSSNTQHNNRNAVATNQNSGNNV